MILKEFGKRVKELRKEQSMSQVDLNEITGITRGQISRIENGKANVTLESIYKISLAFDLKISELLKMNIEEDNINITNNSEHKVKPFVKWAGGKTQLLESIKNLMPKTYKTYYEPFAGGGALFLNLEPKTAVINDTNYELILTYKCFQNRVEFQKLINKLNEHEENHSEEYYYSIRKMDRKEGFSKLKDFEIAARFVYLNKAGFNGLYRVNLKGQFNVPSGKKKTVKTYDEKNFDALYKYLSTNEIIFTNKDFEVAIKKASSGDFVYFDPPYDTFDDKDSFTSYSKNGFGKKEQLRLSLLFKELDKKGVKVMLSNHNTDYIKEIYDGYNQHVVLARRMINSNANGRGNVEEVIITNY